jgi:hypothetical protein
VGPDHSSLPDRAVHAWTATQWTAYRLGFQPQLGHPWFELMGWPVYYPPAFFWWGYFYDAYAPPIFVEGAYIAASGGFISIPVAIGMSVWRAREAKNVETYGSARWADGKEVKAAGLLGPDGVVLGKLDHAYLRHDGPEHVLCFAPTRSGKGVGLVVPSLLTWPGSARVTVGNAILRVHHGGREVAVHAELKGRHGRAVDDAHLAGLVGTRERPVHSLPPRSSSPPAALLRPLAEYEAVAGGSF